MAEWIRVENLPEVIRGLEKAGRGMEAAGLRATNDLALELQGQVRENLLKVQNATPTGPHSPGGPGDFPNRRTGNLASSITVEPRQGFGTYGFEVGPTMEYARILELGWASGVNYPYMKPTADRMRPQASNFFQYRFASYWKG